MILNCLLQSCHRKYKLCPIKDWHFLFLPSFAVSRLCPRPLYLNWNVLEHCQEEGPGTWEHVGFGFYFCLKCIQLRPLSNLAWWSLFCAVRQFTLQPQPHCTKWTLPIFILLKHCGKLKTIKRASMFFSFVLKAEFTLKSPSCYKNVVLYSQRNH